MKFRVFCMSMAMFVLAINTSIIKPISKSPANKSPANSKLPDNGKLFANMVYAGGSFGKARADCIKNGGTCSGTGCEKCVFNKSAIKQKPIKEVPKLPVKEPVVDFGLIADYPFEDKGIVCKLLSEECSFCNNMVVTMEYPPRKTTRTEICRLISPECRSCENIVATL